MKNYFEKIKLVIAAADAELKRRLSEHYIKKASLFVLVFIVFFIALWFIDLFKTPAEFRKVEPVKGEHISQYLSNYIVPELHNKSQLGVPFELVLSQEGINEVLARHIDPNSLAKAGISDLTAYFENDEIVFIAKANYRNFDFIVSMAFKPEIDKTGKLLLKAGDFQVGRSWLPFAAEIIKENIIAGLCENFKAEKNNEFINTVMQTGKIDPSFKINHSKLRIVKVVIHQKELIIYFVPGNNG